MSPDETVSAEPNLSILAQGGLHRNHLVPPGALFQGAGGSFEVAYFSADYTDTGILILEGQAISSRTSSSVPGASMCRCTMAGFVDTTYNRRYGPLRAGGSSP